MSRKSVRESPVVVETPQVRQRLREVESIEEPALLQMESPCQLGADKTARVPRQMGWMNRSDWRMANLH